MSIMYTEEQVKLLLQREKIRVLVHLVNQLKKCKTMKDVREETLSITIACQAVMETSSIEGAKDKAREIINKMKI